MANKTSFSSLSPERRREIALAGVKARARLSKAKRKQIARKAWRTRFARTTFEQRSRQAAMASAVANSVLTHAGRIAMGKKGGKIGGRHYAETHSAEQMHEKGVLAAKTRIAKTGKKKFRLQMAIAGKLGGKAAMAKLTPMQRHEFARLASNAFWDSLTPEQKAAHKAKMAAGRKALPAETRKIIAETARAKKAEISLARQKLVLLEQKMVERKQQLNPILVEIEQELERKRAEAAEITGSGRRLPVGISEAIARLKKEKTDLLLQLVPFERARQTLLGIIGKPKNQA